MQQSGAQWLADGVSFVDQDPGQFLIKSGERKIYFMVPVCVPLLYGTGMRAPTLWYRYARDVQNSLARLTFSLSVRAQAPTSSEPHGGYVRDGSARCIPCRMLARRTAVPRPDLPNCAVSPPLPCFQLVMPGPS